MSANEQRFFKSLEGLQKLVMLDEKGIISGPAGARIESVDGALLQADLALLKYHTFDKKDRQTKKIGVLPSTSREGKRLHEALWRLEGLHIQRNMESAV